MTTDTTPYWSEAGDLPAFPTLDRDVTVDAVVIGGGITGLTTAYLLKEAGMTVAVVERDRCGGGDTSHTSAHLTAVTDGRYTDLVRRFGRDHAEAVWDSGLASIAEIERIIRTEGIECDFRRVPGYLTEKFENADEDGPATLREVAGDVTQSGFDAEYVDAVPALGLAGVRFDGQARLHPLKYIRALVARITGEGSYVFEHTHVDAVTDEPLAVSAGPHTITTSFVVVATHVPMTGKTNLLKATLLQTDLYPYSSYVFGARVEKDRWPDALMWDMSDPYHYVRLDPHDSYDTIIFGGQDHKTGQEPDTRARYAALEHTLRRWLPDVEITHRWSGQVIETRDQLPYIGETSPRQFAITGFCGNGITFGTLGAMMARDCATGRGNPWAELYDAGRTRVAKGMWDYLRENKDYPYYMVRDRFAGAEGRSLRAVPCGEGRIIDLRGKRLAAYRDANGRFSLLSPICPHMGCQVAWNTAESTWDCPCHGSRFSATGDIMRGPAEQGLKSLEGDRHDHH
jgi:glycine/D-amino acid oxidase-like deaminating enzyme/nitrite reductase/ring-hydroxylating ferredoxin subunit